MQLQPLKNKAFRSSHFYGSYNPDYICRCELEVYYRISRPLERGNGYMQIGSIFHAVVEKFCQAEMSLHTALDSAESQLLSAKLHNDVDWKKKPLRWWKENLLHYLRLYLPFAETLRGKLDNFEHKWAIGFAGLRLTGTIDARLLVPCGNLPETILDHKTSSRELLLREYEFKSQSYFYPIAAKALWNKYLPLTYAVAILGRSVKLYVVEKTERELADYLERLCALAARFSEGIVEKRAGWHCRFCDYKDICAKLDA